MSRYVWFLGETTQSHGGPYRVGQEITSLLVENGYDVYVVKREREKGVFGYFTPLLLLKDTWAHLTYGDILIFSGIWSPYVPLLSILTKLKSAKFCIRTCGMMMPYYYKRLRLRHRIALILYVLKLLHSERIVKIANSEREYRILKAFGSCNCRVIRNPASSGATSFCSNELVRSRFDARTILFYSRISHVKGLDLLVRAFNRINAMYPDSSLIIAGPVGSESYLMYCKSLMTNSSLLCTRFLGMITQKDDQMRLFNESSLFILPTRGEGFSNALIEAASSGLPVISTKHSNINSNTLNSIGGCVSSCDSLVSAVSLLLSNFIHYQSCSRNSKEFSAQMCDPYDGEKTMGFVFNILATTSLLCFP